MNLSAINKATANKTRKSGISPFSELDINKIYPNPEQPRKEFDEVLLKELALDITENGLLQPIIVTKKETGYMIVGGERRYKATKEFTSYKTIQAHIIEADDAKVLELALIENIQREDLSDFEIAVYIGKLWSSNNYTSKSELAKAIGKSQSYISKAFGCLRLDESIIKDIEAGKRDIGLSVLEEIARVKDKSMQKEVYELIKKKEITRDEIKNFKELKGWDANKVTETKQKKINLQKEEQKKFVSYGFGTVNDMGNFITLSKGDVLGRVAIDTEDFVKQSSNHNYKITIEEI